MRRACVAIAFLLLSGLGASAQKAFLSSFKENYFITGVPLNTTPDYDTNDLTFQLSVRFNAVQDYNGWDFFWGYTQLSVWDVYRPSNPFRENTYMNGLYASNDRFLAGYEHRSNGRDGDDSRSLDYAFCSYTQPFGRHLAIQATGRMGIGSIGNNYSLEMFNRYQGYFNFGIGYSGVGDRLWLKASVTPLFDGDILANCTAELAFRPFRDRDWFYITAQYHYGYDEAQIDCAIPDVFLRRMLRFGVSVQPVSKLQRLFF